MHASDHMMIPFSNIEIVPHTSPSQLGCEIPEARNRKGTENGLPPTQNMMKKNCPPRVLAEEGVTCILYVFDDKMQKVNERD